MALLKICNKIKDENKILVKADNIIENTPNLESNIAENKEDKKDKADKDIVEKQMRVFKKKFYLVQ